MMLLTALGAAVIMVSRTETAIANNYRNSQEALYAADAAVERVVQDLLMVPRWNDILARRQRRRRRSSSGREAPATQDAAGRRHDDALLRHHRDRQCRRRPTRPNLWGANNPQWRLFAWGPLSGLCSNVGIDSPCTSPSGSPTIRPTVRRAEPTDNNPLLDANGTLTMRAEAIGPGGTRKVDRGHGGADLGHRNRARADRPARTGRTEPARPQSRRADARQGLTNMRMNTATGTLGVQ